MTVRKMSAPPRRRVRGRRRGAVVLVIAALALATISSAAWADLQEEGDQTKSIGGSGHSQLLKWDAYDDQHAPRIRGVVTTGSVGSGKCYDIFFDWFTGGPHYDARIVRDCVSNSQRSTQSGSDGWHDEVYRGGVDLQGMQKAAACVYDISRTSYNNDSGGFTCDQYAHHLDVVGTDEAHGAVSSATCQAFWLRTSNGASYFDGGLAYKCNE
jgi:hypothetical protein